MKTSYLLIAILLISCIGGVVASRSAKTGSLLAIAVLALLGLLKIYGVLR